MNGNLDCDLTIGILYPKVMKELDKTIKFHQEYFGKKPNVIKLSYEKFRRLKMELRDKCSNVGKTEAIKYNSVVIKEEN